MLETTANAKSGQTTHEAATAPASSFVYRNAMKRVLDIVLAIALLPILVPVIGIIYVLVRAEGGPGFFGHTRVGRNGETFRCWKLRTMVPDAQERLEALLKSDPVARAEWDKDQKLRNDPRVTRLGAFLRKSSLDELPQIFNVLKGEMSLVGPRPITTAELERYGGFKWVYLSMRPGVSGLWQVSGRNEASYDERVQFDATYYNTMSMVSDVKILLRTFGAVFNKTGY